MEEFQGIERRSYYDQHQRNTAEITRMMAYWKVLFYFGLTFCGGLISFCVYQNAQTQAIRDIALSLKTTVTAYVATAEQQHQHTLYMIEEMRIEVDKHEEILHP